MGKKLSIRTPEDAITKWFYWHSFTVIWLNRKHSLSIMWHFPVNISKISPIMRTFPATDLYEVFNETIINTWFLVNWKLQGILLMSQYLLYLVSTIYRHLSTRPKELRFTREKVTIQPFGLCGHLEKWSRICGILPSILNTEVQQEEYL